MTLETIAFIGTILVAVAYIPQIFHLFLKEHKIDDTVFAAMKRERIIPVFGVVLIVIGYVFQIPSKL